MKISSKKRLFVFAVIFIFWYNKSAYFKVKNNPKAMTLARYLFFMTVATLLCWGALALVVFFVDPNESGLIGIGIFYAAEFFAVVGTASLIGFLCRYYFQPKEFSHIQVRNSFRQAVWLGFLITGALILQSLNLVTWWILLILVLILTVMEMFVLSLKKQ